MNPVVFVIHFFASVSYRELIGRCLELPKEPKFQINDIIEQNPQKSGCCGFT